MSTLLDATQIDVLVDAARGGDLEAFNQLVVQVYPKLVGFLAFNVPTPELVDEITQSTLVAAYENLHQYQARGSFTAWVRGIARNQLRSELSRRSRLHQATRTTLENLLAESALSELDERRDMTQDDPADHLDRLRGCLQRLSPRLRMIAERRFVEDVPVKVMAQQFKQSCASLAKVIHVLRRDLRACAEGRTESP